MAERSSSSRTHSTATNKSNEEEEEEEEEMIEDVKISDLLPLELMKSEIIPQIPNSSDSAVDWLPEFSGFSWIAYGASSLLVISHFPSPLSKEESLIGPFFRQVIELSSDESVLVKAVAWSPSFPSEGDLAAVVDNCVFLYSGNSRVTHGSFCWSHVGILLHSSTVDTIKWTGSGDGIIAVGVDVALWKRNNQSWEMFWKFKAEQPQTLVSTTWSIEGPAATTAYLGLSDNEDSSSLPNGASKYVLVFQNDVKHGSLRAELQHPQPVSMIQWRPLIRTQSKKDILHSKKDVLLTCCLDGTVRLWSEIDSGRAKKSGKDANDQKHIRRSFHATAVIEINLSMNGTLGRDLFVTWAVEFRGLINTGGAKQCLSTGKENNQPGRCEWLIGFGPGMSVSFWAIHCLDDVSPLRFPRVTLWKRQLLVGTEVSHLHGTGDSNAKKLPLFTKAVTVRSQLFGPPVICYLIQLLPCNSMSWLQLYTPSSNDIEDGSLKQSAKENCLSCSACGVLSLDGHSGRILQIALHPYSCELELLVSLDSNGFLLFWSLSTISSYSLGMPMVGHNSWKLLGKTLVQNISSFDYKSLIWAPSVLNQYRVLLMGHSKGIDCFIIKICESEQEKILCHRLCTIPFFGESRSDAPTNIFAIPLPSDCGQTFMFDNFMLIGVWLKEFQVLSWKVTLHSNDISESSCECSFDTTNGMWVHENAFAGKRYYVVAVPCSSKFPDPHNHDRVTSVAVVCPGTLMPYAQQNWNSPNGLGRKYAAYHMATGCLDGSLKLWRSGPARSSPPHLEKSLSPWEFVGMFCVHSGPINKLSVSNCGRKIATISKAGHLDNVSTLHIWDSICLIGAGNFLVEDKISLDGAVVALNWLTLGNGQLLLGVCLQNELQIYAQRCGSHTLVKSGKSMDMHIWFCLASAHTSPATQEFLWGPRITPILVHERYFCHFSQWSLHVDKKYRARCSRKCAEDDPHNCQGGEDTGTLSAIFTDCNSCNVEELSIDEKREERNSILLGLKSLKVDSQFKNHFRTMAQQQYSLTSKIGWWNMLEVAEKLGGSLPIYNPESLLLNIFAGKWKRAYIAIQHLVGYLKSDNASVTCQYGNYCTRPSPVIPQIHLSKYFEEIFSTSLGDKGLQWGGDTSMVSSSAQFETSSTQFGGYNSIVNVIDLLGEFSGSCSSAYDSFDEPGRRVWVALRFQQFYILRRSGRSASAEDLVVDSELMGWAFHSDCQENLFSSFLSNEPSWQEMRNLGVGFWFINSAELRSRMEKLARLQYLKKKDPKDCALLYIALNRLQVLTGLFKISRDEKDKPMVGFLSRNFQEEKNKAAALKNAYVLLGKHQLELAIAFFLLGGEPSSAVTICAKNLEDEQLALVLCRLLEGYGGPLECHLISKFLLPAAIEKQDHWLSSLLEWTLGNYPRSFLSLLSFETDLAFNTPSLLSNYGALLDPSVGQYCLMLTSKHRMRNSVGESVAATLARWATWMTATALNRCGLPLEALEWLSSSSSTLEDKDQGSVDFGNLDTLSRLLKSSTSDASNWLSGDVAFHLESHAKLDLAIQYLSGLIMEHPVWQDICLRSNQALVRPKEYETHRFKLLHESFQLKLNTGLAIFEQKYALNSLDLINMMLVFSCNHGVPFLGYQILHGYNSQGLQQDEFNNFLSLCIIPTLVLKAVLQVCYVVAQNIVAWSILYSQLTPSSTKSDGYGGSSSEELCARNSYVTRPLRSLNATLQICCSGFLSDDFTIKIFTVIDLFEYYSCFSSAWSLRNLKVLILMVQSILIMDTNEYTPSKVDITSLKKVIYQSAELTTHSLLSDDVRGLPHATEMQGQHEHGENLWSSIPEEERWPFLGACLWQFLSKFATALLQPVFDVLEDGQLYNISRSTLSSLVFSPRTSLSDGNVAVKQINMVTVVLAELLKSSLSCISSSHAKHLASFLRQKVEDGLPIPTLIWLEKSRSQPRPLGCHLDWKTYDLYKINDTNQGISFEILWEISTDPKEIWKGFAQENVSWLQFFSQKSSRSWSNIHKETIGDCENADISSYDQGGRHSNSSNGAGSPAQYRSLGGHSSLGPGSQASTITREAMCFEHPKEMYKKNGELIEAICINSIDQRQTALASNKKGITFFKWKNEEPFKDLSGYIWSEADWPQDGWAGSESTPIPTFVSPGVGLGSKKGSHLGLGGATIGLRRPSAKPGKEMTGGGAFGIPGYAGIGASGLGWGLQEDFEEFVDLPATVENISTRALSSHPTRPLFLVGSSNTHVYLWEFGKDRATATYGVLPAANVPPPYALASISALQFDHCGQRFATAALDGTVCTWQLEVGGRSNVRPTEAALCFNSHALDVSYVAGSGSIIAAAGCSSNGVNVVIWDTLAPSTTSQASLICHEGGARSLSVFDHDIGSGSISPLIVTGGKGGDVGVHDFRFIATGRTKRNRQSNASEQNTKSSLTHDRQSGTSNKFGEQNLNGMLWYIPKAHLGSVTRISTIPNTSLFLTGSKDGDVKLWDAKRAELVFHWPKLHDKHTFLQPSSRGFGGVVRAAVTDIQVLSDGFLTCGGDGTVKLIQLKDFHQRT
ncbi:uncharacterized protein LOC122060893 isoform X2 [Macadamia integrifolia]|uniref:uncharacterized protein LOC122060893 isoform X2 n=1 Tax=Macadamia integrifolia TaxID=60698 RepID=UPI001C531D49|nr:uncharacterized protein LOC122060893 isoform X2 [Macadamia integrifolia]